MPRPSQSRFACNLRRALVHSRGPLAGFATVRVARYLDVPEGERKGDVYLKLSGADSYVEIASIATNHWAYPLPKKRPIPRP